MSLPNDTVGGALMGLAFIVVGAFVCFFGTLKAKDYEAAHQNYRRQRAAARPENALDRAADAKSEDPFTGLKREE